MRARARRRTRSAKPRREKAGARRRAKPATRARSPERSARWLAQREHLLQSAQRAIHRRGPQVPMDEIAAEAGITKPILYRHFGDRRGLARALRDGALGPLLGVAKDTPLGHHSVRERIVAMYPVVSDAEELRRVVVGFATGFLMFVGMSPNLYRFLRAEGVLDEMWEAESGGALPREPVAESIARSLQTIYRGARISDTTADIWAHALRAMASGMVDWWIDTPGCDRFELERNIDRIAQVVVAGLGQTLAAERSLARGVRRKPAARRTRKPAARRTRKPAARRAPKPRR